MCGEKELTWFKWAEEATHPGKAARKPEALDDLLVLDVSQAHIGGLVCSSMLAEMGARVIRIEPPSGDLSREFSPFGLRHQDIGLGYLAEGRNKHHITLNLAAPRGQEILRSFAGHADVVIETFKPGTMDAWGIG
jgi:crotonobetainyl-CoA:carnitine CoA-transferase CaiB-like acyl-CoA transferase